MSEAAPRVVDQLGPEHRTAVWKDFKGFIWEYCEGRDVAGWIWGSDDGYIPPQSFKPDRRSNAYGPFTEVKP